MRTVIFFFFLQLLNPLFASDPFASDPYQILGIGKNASPEEIKKAFIRLAIEVHPDVNPAEDSEKRFIAVRAAYEQLSKKGTPFPSQRSHTGNTDSGDFSSPPQQPANKLRVSEQVVQTLVGQNGLDKNTLRARSF